MSASTIQQLQSELASTHLGDEYLYVQKYSPPDIGIAEPSSAMARPIIKRNGTLAAHYRSRYHDCEHSGGRKTLEDVHPRSLRRDHHLEVHRTGPSCERAFSVLSLSLSINYRDARDRRHNTLQSMKSKSAASSVLTVACTY